MRQRLVQEPQAEGTKALVRQKQENLTEGLDQETDKDNIHEPEAEGACELGLEKVKCVR